MKNILQYTLFSLFTLLLSSHIGAYAVNENENIDTGSGVQIGQEIDTLDIQYKKEIYINNPYTISLEDTDEQIRGIYPEKRITYSWDIFGQESQDGNILNVSFESPGKKQISLNIYSQDVDPETGNLVTDSEKTLIYTQSFFPLVYSYSIPLFYDGTLPEKELEDYINAGADAGVFFYQIGDFDESNIDQIRISNELENFSRLYEANANYIVIWGGKEYIFSTLSKFETQSLGTETKYNFILMSSYNNVLLQNYIENSIAGKNIVGQGFIIDDFAKMQILKFPQMIGELQSGLDRSSYDYRDINTNIEISPILFVSNFIKELSLSGVKNSDIYIILLIPIFLTFVSVSKHIIGFSTLGNIIPVFLAIMFFKLGVIFTLFVLGFLFVFNLLIARFLNKYTLLYTPKVSLITIANLLFFMLFYELTQYTDYINIPLQNIIYVVLLFLVSERFISIITTKEYREYKKSIWGTCVVALLCFALFYIDPLLVFLFAYPEILLILIPFNFFLGKFTGLRITEYFRFGEIIKNAEQEE